MIIVHVGYEEKTWNAELLAYIPCLYSARFDTGLAVDNNDSCVGNGDSLLYFAHEIEVARSVEYIDL